MSLMKLAARENGEKKMTNARIFAIYNKSDQQVQLSNKADIYEEGNEITVAPYAVAPAYMIIPIANSEEEFYEGQHIEISLEFSEQYQFIFQFGDCYCYCDQDDYENREDIDGYSGNHKSLMLTIEEEGTYSLEHWVDYSRITEKQTN
jgi:hypothetical protein